MGNYHARCGAGEKPEAAVPEVYLLPFALPDDYCSLLKMCIRDSCDSFLFFCCLFDERM